VGEHSASVTDSALSTQINTVLHGQFQASDADGDALSFSITQQGGLGQIVIVDTTVGLFDYTPDANVTGVDTVLFSVDDGFGGITAGTLTVTVNTSANAAVALQSFSMDLYGVGAKNEVGVRMFDPVSSTESVYIKDARSSNSTLGSFVLDSVFSVIDVASVPDMNASGTAEIAVLGRRASNGTVRVRIRDGVSGATLQDVYFNSVYVPSNLVVMNDQNANGSAELAVLGVNVTGGVAVQVKDSLTAGVVGTSYYGSTFSALDLVVVPDTDANGVDELAVLGEKLTGGVTQVQLRDAVTGAFVRNVYFNPNWTAQHLKVLPDMNGSGSSELAMLALDAVVGNGIQIQTKDAVTDVQLSVLSYGNTSNLIGFEVLPDLNGNGVSDVGVLGVDKLSGAVSIHINDALTGGYVKHLFYNSAYVPVLPSSITLYGNVDGIGGSEVGVLGADLNGASQIQLKDSSLGTQVGNIMLP